MVMTNYTQTHTDISKAEFYTKKCGEKDGERERRRERGKSEKRERTVCQGLGPISAVNI